MEIWLPYGDTEIVLDIKAENLLDDIRYQRDALEENRLEEVINNISRSHINICVLENNRILADLAVKLKYMLGLKDITTTLFMHNSIRNYYKEHNPRPLDDSIYDKDDTLLLSIAGFDPLFGYKGMPTAIARMNNDLMQEIIDKTKEPSPGKITNALTTAYKHVESFSSRSMEVIINGNKITDIVMDEPIKASQKSIRLLEQYKVKSEKTRSIVIGSGYTHTLSDSLRVLWNCFNLLRDDANVILLAEGRDGLGSKALDMLVQGRLEAYIEGMEDIKFLNFAKSRYNISLITSLPDYYLKVIGFRAFRSINHALKYLLSKNPRQKVTVVRDASNIMLISE